MTRAAKILHSFALCALALYARGTGAQIAQPAQLPQQAAPRSPVIMGQPTESCLAGRIFGITEFICTQCRMSSPRDSGHVVYSFSGEPTVLETDNPAGRVRPGDKIVAVNGSPITTRAGADQFAYPPIGIATLTISRNNQNISFEQPVQTQRYCPVIFRTLSVGVDSLQRVTAGAVTQGGGGGGGRGGRVGGVGGGGGGGGAGARGNVIRADSAGFVGVPDSLIARMRAAAAAGARGGAILRAAPTETVVPTVQLRDFGLTLKCVPICIRARTRDGTTSYSRFDGFPTVSNPSPTSVAGKAGLRDGDVLLLVNGVSPQVEEGALILNRAEREPITLQLEVRRGAKTEKITLKM